MKATQQILQRQAGRIRFKNQDMDFMFSWAIGAGELAGLAASQLFHAMRQVKDGDPAAWRQALWQLGTFEREQATAYQAVGEIVPAGRGRLAACLAERFSLQLTDPADDRYPARVAAMENAFQEGVRCLGIPIRPIEVPFEQTSLPGYFLEHDDTPRPTIVVIGGGDTFREDLFWFGGYPGWKRGYNVLMADLPGQGNTPARGLCFRADMHAPISALLDWHQANAAAPGGQIALYGLSGGGYFTAQAAADRRISAWVASTPITDIAEVFRKEFGTALKAPSWLLTLTTKLLGSSNAVAGVNLRKYAWQFGTKDFRAAVDQVFAQAKPVNSDQISCPTLFLVGQAEAVELQRQTRALHQRLKDRGLDTTLREFTADEGADAHCQVNNFRLAHLVVFGWLDRVLQHAPLADIRLAY